MDMNIGIYGVLRVFFYLGISLQTESCKRVNNVNELESSDHVSIVTKLYGNSEAAKYVNPLIGTAGEGFNYPGATTPWGMVSASPHTTYTTPLGYITGQTIAPAGYYSGEPFIEGFGQTHLSGVACNELGAPVIAVNTGDLDPGEYKSSYSKEVAKAGYYSVYLDDLKTKVEITSTKRTAFYRFKFSQSGPNFVVLDAKKNLSWGSKNGFIERAGKNSFSGWSQTGKFCYQENKQKVFFYIKAMTPNKSSDIWTFFSNRSGKKSSEGTVGAWFSYEEKRTAEVAIGISYVSSENARENLEAEIGSKNFQDILIENIAAWEGELSKVRILDSGHKKEKEIFYTALYHSLLHPNLVSDVSGTYPAYEQEGSGVNTENPRYGLFSLWDTYRTIHPLLNLLYPAQQQDMLYTLEDMTISAGHTPRWELYGSEVNLMVGDPALSVMAEGAIKGYRFKNPKKLFEILYRNATDRESTWRPGNAEYLKMGYIPQGTDEVWGTVSTTLEYAYHDWALSRFAKKIGRSAEAESLVKQSRRWRTLFDRQKNLIRPKQRDGRWVSNFDPAEMNDSFLLSLFVENHGGPGFVEGNSYQYTYMVPHDILGLVDAFGSIEKYSRKLKFIFDHDFFSLWNEPDMIYPYLIGVDPLYLKEMQEQLQLQRTKHFSTKVDGIPGNDDAGTLSAWYVFTALGFYPVNPASGDYAIGIPLFKEIRLTIPGSDKELIISSDFDVARETWNTLLFDGKELKKPVISHAMIMRGGSLQFRKN